MEPYELGISKDIVLRTKVARLGEGFNSFSLDRIKASLFTKEALNTVEEQVSPDLDLHLEISESLQELASKLNIHAQMAASYMGNSVEGTADYMHETESSANTLFVTIRGNAVYKRGMLEMGPKTKNTILEYMRDPGGLVQQYGDYFCSQLDYGAELIIFLKVIASSTTDKQNIAASLKTSFGIGAVKVDASVSMSKAISQHTAQARTEFSFYQSGGLAAPEGISLDDLMKYWRTYFTEKNAISLIAATYTPWTNFVLEDDIRVADALNIKKQLKAALEPAWKTRDKYLRYLAGYDLVLGAYTSAYENGTYLDKEIRQEYPVYLPTEYYKFIRADIERLTKLLGRALSDNAGSMDLPDPDPLIRGCSADLPELVLKDKRRQGEIQKGFPEYYEEKLKKRRIIKSDLFGGPGGNVFDDEIGIKNVEGITSIRFDSVYWQPSIPHGAVVIKGDIRKASRWVLTKFQWTARARDGKAWTSPEHAPDLGGKRYTLTLAQGDYIEEIGVYSDVFVCQLIFVIRRHNKKEKELVCIPESLDPGLSKVVQLRTITNMRFVGFHGHAGKWLDAIGFYYIEE